MDIEDIRKLIVLGESEILECKKSTAQLSAAFETACAFLNGIGGIIFIGINNKFNIVGQHVTDATQQEIANHCAKLEPSAQPHIQINYISIENNKSVVAIIVDAGSHIPYTYDGRPFYRNQSTTRRIPQHYYEQLIVKRGQLNHSWETQAAIGYDINDLDHEEIKRTIDRGIRKGIIPSDARDESVKEILGNRFNLLLENNTLKNAAVILFAKNVMPAYTQCLIKLARFKGTDELGGFIDNKRFYGNVFAILSAADHFIMRHLPVASSFSEDNFERIDKPTLPTLALREAFINAISHRDYSVRSASIYLAIFDDRLEIWNNGTLPPQLKIGDLKKNHKSYPRNEIIAEVFFRRGLVEGWGKGTNTMVKVCQEHSVPEPEFKEYSGGLGVTFKFRNSIGKSIKKVIRYDLSQRQEAILEIIGKHTSAHVQQIIADLEDPPTQRTIQTDLSKLKKLNYVDSKGKGKATVWFLL